jgi:hypothetical protein
VHLMQRLLFLAKERGTHFTNAAKQSAPPQEFALTPNRQDEEILAPVREVFELLIIEPAESEEDPFMVSVPMSAVGARLRAAINQHTATIHMGRHMVYDGSIIQDNVALGQGYGIQDQFAIHLYPRGEMVAPIFNSCPASSSDVRRIGEPTKGVQIVLHSGAAQSLLAGEEGNHRCADGREPTGHEADPSGQLTLPNPLEAGGRQNPRRQRRCRFLILYLLLKRRLGS